MKLTDEEIKDILVSIDPDTKRLPPGFRDFARAIEVALSAKQGEQEPVAWLYENEKDYRSPFVSLTNRYFGPDASDWKLTPLYTHPAPSVNAQEQCGNGAGCCYRAALFDCKEERISELEAKNAQLLEKAKELCDRIYDEGCTPLDWREYDDLRAAIAAVQSNASTHSLNSANSLE